MIHRPLGTRQAPRWPFGIQVVPQQVLRDQQAIRFSKALDNLSGVYHIPSGTSSFDSSSLRGFVTGEYYRDGVRQLPGLLQTGFRALANIERVEVLKGPAAILYGRIEPGGLINLVTKQPLGRPYYALQQQFGSFDLYRTTIEATGPVTQDDSLLYRLDLSYENSGSFREFLENDQLFLAPVLQWNISPQTQANFYLEYVHGRDPFDNGIPILGNRPAPVPRERNFAEPGSGRIEDEEVRIGFNWSQAFNEHWTVRHRVDANFLDTPTGAFVTVDGLADPTQCSESSCPVARSIFQNLTQSAEVYNTTLDLNGRFDTWGLSHTLLLGGDYFYLLQCQLSGWELLGSTLDRSFSSRTHRRADRATHQSRVCDRRVPTGRLVRPLSARPGEAALKFSATGRLPL